MILPVLLEDNGEGAVAALRDVDHALFELSEFLLKLFVSDLIALAAFLHFFDLFLDLFMDGVHLLMVVLADILEAAEVLVLELGLQTGLLAVVALVKGLDVPAMLHTQLRNCLPVVLLFELKLVLQVVDLALEVQAHFLQTGFQGSQLLLLELNDLFLLETDESTDDLVRGQLHRGLLLSRWLRILIVIRLRWGRWLKLS